MSVQEHFALLASAALRECESVNCSIPEFVEGLDVVIDKLAESRAAAEQCLLATGEAGRADRQAKKLVHDTVLEVLGDQDDNALPGTI